VGCAAAKDGVIEGMCWGDWSGSLGGGSKGSAGCVEENEGVGVLDRQTYQGVPEVVDFAVRIVIGRPRTRRYAQGHGTQDLYRFGLPRWQTLRPIWGIKYGALRLVLG
jgi:hypothetical protein